MRNGSGSLKGLFQLRLTACRTKFIKGLILRIKQTLFWLRLNCGLIALQTFIDFVNKGFNFVKTKTLFWLRPNFGLMTSSFSLILRIK